jgi:hypothetical protein
MVVDEAFRELGIERTVTADEARRAYLRLLKTRKPEVDPDGFRRLREAYELVRALLERHEVRLLPTSAAVASAPPSASGQTSLPKSEYKPPLAPAPVSPQVPAPIDPDVERLRTIQRLVKTDHPRTMQNAVTMLAEHYVAVARRLDAPVPPPAVTMVLLLRAHESTWLSKAAQLEAAFASWLQATGDEPRAIGAAAPQWVFARELGRLPERLSPPVRTILARAGLTGDVDRAMASLAQLRRDDSVQAKTDAAILRMSGGSVSSRAAAALAPAVTWRTTLGKRWRVLMMISIAAGSMARVIPCEPATSPQSAPATVTESLASPRHSFALDLAAQKAGALAREADAQEEGLVAERARSLGAALAQGRCDDAEGLAEALRSTPASAMVSGHVTELVTAATRACGDLQKAGP